MERVKNRIIALTILCLRIFWGISVSANLPEAKPLQLPYLFSDNMVVQQNSKVPINGIASPNEPVTIEGSWGVKQTVRSNGEGKWKTLIETPKAIKGEQPFYSITISTNNETVILKNILVGDVWICSGQSNMEMILDSISVGYSGVVDHKSVLSNVTNPLIRLFKAERSAAQTPADNVKGKWLLCEPEPARWYSAVAYFFAKELTQKLGYPIGLVNISWGGATCQSYIKKEVLENDPVLETYLTRDYSEEDRKNNPNYLPSLLYNGMVHPVVGFPIKGTIWYQGEANRIDQYNYSRMLSAMINNWRSDWGQGDFPFYYVEIAPYLYDPTGYSGDTPGNHTAALLREQQRKVLALPNTAMVSTVDIGEPYNIHPKNKQDVGKRLALTALKNTYKYEVQDQGPLYKSLTIENNKVRVSFDENTVNNGLELKPYSRSGFYIADDDHVFHEAKVLIDGKTVVLWHPDVEKPIAVRYCFSDAPRATLFGKNGLPAPAFRSDNWTVAMFNMENQTGAMVEKHFNTSFTKTIDTDYLLYLPKGFDQSKKYPLMVFLHGSGERGNNPNQIKVHGIPKAIVDGTQFDFILIAPQCKTGIDWQTENLYHLITGVIQQYPVDKNRVYLTGMSMGGTGTWDLAFDYPELFAAIAPVCGRINRNHPEKISRLKDMPVWAFHGELDDVVPLGPAKKMVDNLKEIGAPVKMTIYPGVYHNSFDFAFKEPGFYQWFLLQNKK